AGERLSAAGVDELGRRRREVARPHRVGWNRRVLIEHVVRFVAVVVDLKVGAAILVLVEAGNLDRTAERAAEGVLRERRLGDGEVRTHLVGRAVQRGAAERVAHRALIWPLSSRTAAAECERTRAAEPARSGTARPAAASAESPRASTRPARAARRA